jgi:mannose-6-phosphate isomerase-like protein (cupin superfamily)
VWGDGCDGWHLLQEPGVSVIQERVPAGKSEVLHYHHGSLQFFFILEGEGTLVFQDRNVTLRKGEGLEISPGVPHRFCNRSTADVRFLVISTPPSHGDRVNV